MIRAKSSGFGPSLIELVAAVLLFALCSAVCVKIFARAKLISDDGANLSCAVVAAQSAAECFKSCGGDAGETAKLLEGNYNNESFSVYYDADWNSVGGDGKFVLIGIISEEHGLKYCKVTVTDGEDEVFCITTAAHGEVLP